MKPYEAMKLHIAMRIIRENWFRLQPSYLSDHMRRPTTIGEACTVRSVKYTAAGL